MFLGVNHLHSDEKSYLALLFGKCVPSPSSLQHNGLILKFSFLMSLNTPCTPLTTQTTLDGYFKLHPHACFIGNSQIGQCTTLGRNGYNVKTLLGSLLHGPKCIKHSRYLFNCRVP